MKTGAKSSAITALGTATATTETSIGNIVMSAKAKRIVGIWAYVAGGAGTTTLENISGIFRLNSGDVDVTPFEIPLDVIVVLTSGTAAFSPRIVPVSIDVKGQETLEGYATLDLAQTIAHKARWGVIFERD